MILTHTEVCRQRRTLRRSKCGRNRKRRQEALDSSILRAHWQRNLQILLRRP